MVLPGDPPECGYGIDECGNCHAELDNGRHICMADFTVPSSESVILTVFRAGQVYKSIILNPGDTVEFNVIDDDVMFASDEDEDEANR